MFGVFFMLIVLVGLYFAYLEGMHRWQKYLDERNEILKSKTVEFKDYVMPDDQFVALLEKNWLKWGRAKGIIR